MRRALRAASGGAGDGAAVLLGCWMRQKPPGRVARRLRLGQGRRSVCPRTEPKAERYTFPDLQRLPERSLRSPGGRLGGFRFPGPHLRRPRGARCGGVCAAWAPPPAASGAEAGPQPGPPAARPAVSVSPVSRAPRFGMLLPAREPLSTLAPAAGAAPCCLHVGGARAPRR